MSHGTIGANIRRFRAASRMSQKDLAKAAGLSLAGLRKIENHLSVPRVDTVQSIAKALSVPVRALVTPVPELRSVRFRSFKSLKTREQILAEVALWLQGYNELEELLGESRSYPLKNLAISSSGSPRAVESAALARQKLGLSADEPVRDLCGLLEANGIKVSRVSIASDAFFGLSIGESDGGPAVIVNTWERISVERQIFTAAHELGHLVLHSDDYVVAEKEESTVQEQEANAFASHFLMPDAVFRREWDETYGMGLVERVLKVKRIFRVSYRTVLYRLAEEIEDKSSLWRQFQLQYKRRFGKTLLRRDEPDALATDLFRASAPESSRAGEPERLSQADFMEDRLPLLVRIAIEKQLISLSRGAEILSLGLDEMRELARSWIG